MGTEIDGYYSNTHQGFKTLFIQRWERTFCTEKKRKFYKKKEKNV